MPQPWVLGPKGPHSWLLSNGNDVKTNDNNNNKKALLKTQWVAT